MMATFSSMRWRGKSMSTQQSACIGAAAAQLGEGPLWVLQHPRSGALFAIHLEVAGRPAARFA
jgi:sugar lactone lactonase YvrE